ncbi:unnamed protein product [Citrullus colocynthis]|uniref:Uncharacterized protein n=1 Tax=Citrullus colocynthis TaxID=252529 RepID=A0ABP0Y7U2_9ROSI
MHCMTISQRRGSLTLSLYKAKQFHGIGLVQFVRLRPKSFFILIFIFLSSLASSFQGSKTLLLLFSNPLLFKFGVSILQE